MPNDFTPLPTILLADDNPVNSVIAYTFLTQNGYTVLTAQNGRVALATVEEHDVDLMLLDCRMPIVDGYQVAQTIREREAADPSAKPLPIIAVTGDVSPENRKECANVGMNDLLAKPFTPEDLVEVVERWLPGIEQAAESESPADTAPDNAAGAATADKSVLDHAALDLIRDLDSTGEVLERLIRLFLNDAVHDLVSIRQEEPGAAKKAAHNMKSSAANMGAMRLAGLCADLEKILVAGDEELRVSTVEQIDTTFEETKTLLERELPAA